ncbi:MAG: GAF domain-containing protein [Erysipelotrichaceae bacterium]|nr:GAF domain-containing protein [Erysipelotrichaceae bacterium]
MDYELLKQQVREMVRDQRYLVTLLSNTSALLYQSMQYVNWLGYYLYQDDQLILGPFQGKVACEIIPLDRGVCGKAARERATVLVEDVHQFAGHIACDSASNSEIVIPIIINDRLFGVLDIDSPLTGRFSQTDRENLEEIVRIIEERIGWYEQRD